MKIGLYLKGNDHTIEKYSQVLLLFRLLRSDPRFKTYIVIDDDFYEELEPLLHQDLGEVIKLSNDTVIGPDKLDVIIMITPYPPQPKPPLRKWETKIIYKEYGTTGIDNGYKTIWSEDAVYKYSDMIITDSLHTKMEIVDVLGSDKGVVGSPAYDYKFYVDRVPYNDGLKHILWTPHHSIYSNKLYDGIFGGRYSTWLSYKDFIPSLVNKYPIKLHIKIHPNMHRRYKSWCSIHHHTDDYDEYINKLKNTPNIEVLGNENYHQVFMNSDAILNDSISFLQEYLPTNKPMCVLYDEGRASYNDYGEQLIDKCYYRAHDEAQIEEFIDSVVNDKLDHDKLVSRSTFINNYYIDPNKPNVESLVDIIYNKYNK